MLRELSFQCQFEDPFPSIAFKSLNARAKAFLRFDDVRNVEDVAIANEEIQELIETGYFLGAEKALYCTETPRKTKP